jgi:hypothetical protein
MSVLAYMSSIQPSVLDISNSVCSARKMWSKLYGTEATHCRVPPANAPLHSAKVVTAALR